MVFSCLNSGCFLSSILLGSLLLVMNSGFESAAVPTFSNETDGQVLLDFKNRITQDPLQIMSLWNASLHFCKWVGVTCSPSNGRVMILNLESQRLVGSIPPSIGNLTFLTGINLQNNSFNGEIPQEMGRLRLLQHLNFSQNAFVGHIPTNLTHCSELTVLDLVYNELVGPIPDQLSSLSQMLYWGLGANNLTGRIPAWIGNCSSLVAISLVQNNLQGNIPHELGSLSSLKFFQISSNEISGSIPSSIYNISSIFFFSFARNQLHGQLPSDIGFTLPNLKEFYGGGNNFSGPIPVSLPNASGLQMLDFPENSLTGTVPTNLGSLQAIYRIIFDYNKLGNEDIGNLLTFLTNCTSLEELGLVGNLFGGKLPNSVANLSTNLKMLTLGSNLIYGSIPYEIGNLTNLTNLGLEGNFLTGRVPDAMGKLQHLGKLYLNANNLSGPIPSSLGNLTSLNMLFIDDNRLEGSIPSSLGKCHKLEILVLSSNNLSGTIPKEVMAISSLTISLAMAHNFLTGSLPSEVGKLINLVELDVSDNRLSGQIPSTLSSCLLLERLLMKGNLLQGTIPESLKTLRGLEEIDLSQNNLSGQIPKFLGKFSFLKKLDLSFNNFKGEVSREGIFANVSAISILGNNQLCGGVLELHLPACSQGNSHSSAKLLTLRVLIPVTVSIVLIVILLCSFAAWCTIRNPKTELLKASSTKDWQSGVSYADVVKSTNGFSMDNLIGSGSFGSVYKGVVNGDGAKVAIKVLNLEQQGAYKSFIDECKALKSIRHRNLLKIITACSSVDYQGNDFKCLIFEFMSNGSLDFWLHPKDGEQRNTKNLSIIQRLNIAMDVASALDYLHHHCETPIVHCDLKPSNVILDEDMTAHVGDFGLARFLFEAPNNPSKYHSISIGLKGSVGYIPPEYVMGGQVSTLGDVYSYGILLLEVFTGKRPTEDIFTNGLNLPQLVAMALPENVMEVVDPSLLLAEEEDNLDENEDDEEERAIIKDDDPQCTPSRNQMVECLVSVMKIGLSCSTPSPMERLQMSVVVNKLQKIKDSFLGFRKRSGRV
ncbi:unnamed protein product [Ilex paraguariensis]|uniref:non-specific serine/threonine protein kinase n=1 Tax=Ilex paraguariensis TaxID=185542 RepID=A0ABC8QND9_9AQUA